MYYELYIDILFLENFMMDSLTLLSAGILFHGWSRGTRLFRRCVLGGALGSLLTCLVVMSPLPSAVKYFFFHVVINSLMILTGFQINNGKQFAKAMVCLYASAIIYGGVMQFFRPFLRSVALFYGIAVGSGLVVTALERWIGNTHRRAMGLCQVELYIGGEKKGVRALLDTGNRLTDPLTKDPVSILDVQCAREWFGEEHFIAGMRYIPYHCISGESVMRVIRIEKMCIYGSETQWISHPLLGISEETVSPEGEYQLILNEKFEK